MVGGSTFGYRADSTFQCEIDEHLSFRELFDVVKNVSYATTATRNDSTEESFFPRRSRHDKTEENMSKMIVS